MAIAATCVFEVRSTGSDNNGGGYNPAASSPGTDRSQQDTAQVVIDGVTISATVHTTTTQITLVGYTVATTDKANLVQITGGTATAGVYEITATDTVNNRWTLDRSAGSSTQTVVGNMGGAYATPGKADSQCRSDGGAVWVKAGTYTLSSTASVAGGRINGQSAKIGWRGYNTTRGDWSSTRPILQPGNNSMTVVTLGAKNLFDNFEIQNNSKTGCIGIGSNNADNHIRRCKVTSMSSDGINLGEDRTTLEDCYVASCTGSNYVLAGDTAVRCVSKSSGSHGFDFSNSGSSGAHGVCIDCISLLSTGRDFALKLGTYINCTAYGGSSDGFSCPERATLANCISEGHTGGGKAGFVFTPNAASNKVPAINYLLNCSSYNDTSAKSGDGAADAVMIESFQTLSASPFVNAAGNNFALTVSTTARATGLPSAFDGISTTAYPDRGAAQSSSTAGGGHKMVGPGGMVG